MSAYLRTLIDGNVSFGGYLSVDGEKAISIENDMTYEISPGRHKLTIYSTSNFQRGTGSFQAALYNNTGSSGAIMDALERKSIEDNIGDGWVIEVDLDDHDMCEIETVSKGSKLVATPAYIVRELDDDEVKSLEKMFEEWRNTPIRSKKKITWGIVLAVLGVILLLQSGNTLAGETEMATIIAAYVMYVAMLAGGVALIVTGAKKKIRRK